MPDSRAGPVPAAPGRRRSGSRRRHWWPVVVSAAVVTLTVLCAAAVDPPTLDEGAELSASDWTGAAGAEERARVTDPQAAPSPGSSVRGRSGATAAVRVPRPDTRTSSGLPWPSGVVVGLPDFVERWATFRGRPVDVVNAYTDRSSWEHIVTAGWVLGEYADHPADLVISQPFWPEGSGGSLEACRRGDYDAQWTAYGRNLTAADRTDAYTRLAWEFNGDWFEWSATDVDAWKSCFRRVVGAVRSTAPDARFEWTINAHDSQTSDGNAWNSYPGHDVVDVVGIDSYDGWPASHDEAGFTAQCNGQEGLCTAIRFAYEHGKQIGVSEWGVLADTAAGGGGGDNPFYIEKMFAIFESHQDVIAYETYYNDAAFSSALIAPPQNPRSAERYAALFGRA